MIKRLFTILQNQKLLNILLILLGLLYLLSLTLQYINFNFNEKFGYLDQQLFWQGLSDLSSGKVIYRDFYWEYGILYLLIGLPFFILFGKTFFIASIIRFYIFPTISIILSFFIGKQVFNKKALLLFLFLLFLYSVNNDFTSLRHLLPELGLITLILGTETNARKKIYIGSIFLGLSLISSIEYSVMANVCILIYFLGTFLRKIKPTFLFFSIKIFFLIETVIVLPYIIFLGKSHALINMISFHTGYIKSFSFNSPCQMCFPRLNEINSGIDFFQRLNLYFIPLILLLLLIWVFLYRKKHQYFIIILILLIFSSLIYYRTLNTPCLGYMNYGLLFFFLILIFLFFQTTVSSKYKWFLGISIIWFILLPIPGKISQLFAKAGSEKSILPSELMMEENKNTSEKKYLPIAGIKLNQTVTNEYLNVINYIQANTNKQDTLFVYPNGPYYQLTDRKSAVSIASNWYYDLVPSLEKITLDQLEKNKPKFIIINSFNAISIKTSLNGIPYNIHSEENDIFFESITTPVEDFIVNNYEIAEKFKIAWILKRRASPILAKQFYLPIKLDPNWEITIEKLNQQPYLSLDNSLELKVNEPNPKIYFSLKSFKDISQIVFPLKIDFGSTKIFSKYVIDINAITENGKNYLINEQFATSNWQNIYANLPTTIDNSQITKIYITISNNRGFFWFGKPDRIFIKTPQAYTRNPNLKITDSIF